MTSRWFTSLLCLVAAFGMTAAAQDAKLVEAGKKAYVDYDCKKCHRIGGPSKKLHDLDGVATRISDDEMRKWLMSPDDMTKKLKKKPATKMKKQDFKPGEVDALIAYLKTLK